MIVLGVNLTQTKLSYLDLTVNLVLVSIANYILQKKANLLIIYLIQPWTNNLI